MALNSSGPISLGGATTGQSINLEVGVPATSTVSLNDTVVRTLAGVATGQIVVPTDFYGKSLSSGYFQIITTSAAPVGPFDQFVTNLLFDSATNTFFISGRNQVIQSDTSGNILYATQYSSSAFSWFLSAPLELSLANSNYLIATISSQSNPPPTASANTPGIMFVYLDKTTGAYISAGVKSTATGGVSNGSNSGGPRVACRDFGPGNRMQAYSSPPGAQQLRFLNSSSADIGNLAGAVNPTSPPGTRASMGFFRLMNSPTSISVFNGRSAPIGGGIQMITATDTGSVTSAVVFGSMNGNASFPTITYPVASNPSFAYIHCGNSVPVPAGIYKLDRSSNTIVSSVVTPATPASTGLYQSTLTKNTDASGNFCLLRPSNVGTQTLNFMTSSLSNPSAYVLTSSSTPSIQCYPSFYFDGYLYMYIIYATNILGILKIKEDGSTLGSGITASVGGYNITLTQNPTGLLSLTSGGSFSASPYAQLNPATGFNTSPVIGATPSALSYTQSKVPV